jgi:FKBP-type peptidyl-prolyl cis-trans isomerase
MRSISRARTVVSIAVLAVVSGVAWGCGSVSPVAPDQSNVEYQQTDLVVGTGTEAGTGNNASVQFTGWLYNATAADNKGTQFQTGQLTFLLGGNQVIRGFEMAVTGMKVGGSRRAIIPPSLAFGADGNGPIPPNAALVFEIALLSVQ